MTVRDVTVVPPPAEVIIDRSFYAQPPSCATGDAPFQFKPGESYAHTLVDAVSAISTPVECLKAVSQWIETERKQRGLTDESTDG